ncbi:antitoxin Xre/MbcA/ParS toxin-binding domain-containing protein [Candidatus Deferrimicrobium sp.]|uniref:antitoxin Xre/MbcA/ParS toxin-binding domain-containing protein n=1 Tax=Candidatus Deferrimicrobium sp. TaxID=3060586 RepID=UPI002ED102BA
MISVREIAKVLGVRGKVHSLAELNRLVETGLPKASLKHVVSLAFEDRKQWFETIYRLVPIATYKRRKETLSREESEKTERLARVVATAYHVWEDPGDTMNFLSRPHPSLGGKTPVEYSATELGARQVEEMLWAIFYGLPA